MSLTQFSMVEELAFLVKDNLPCKHLVLSMEDMLVEFLQKETSLNEVLELEPMNPYNRLLLHRLADIFGSLLLQCHPMVLIEIGFEGLYGLGFVGCLTWSSQGHCLLLLGQILIKTFVLRFRPSILVADLLWEHDDYHSPITSQLLTRLEDGSTGIVFFSAKVSLEDREAAYLAARKRIFSTENADMASLAKERPRNNPIVAQRMIAHALGQRIKQPNEVFNKVKNQSNGQTSLQAHQKSNSEQHLDGKVPQNLETQASTNVTVSSAKKHDTKVPVHNLKEERTGAAKRMFANALRMHPAKETVISKGDQSKPTDKY
ncbi:hypothetical protein E3N88_22261 [Mikania micrantha]|uniref:R3H domain-containing protein n=1 Tax=Mikania micrantha TaxID=192012 RepID=A0A5N6NBS6_9ASTR|nr:hypothetical protein E3N88_22261 [Mikania micrantha]